MNTNFTNVNTDLETTKAVTDSVTGDVVGTENSQTLQNKTIASTNAGGDNVMAVNRLDLTGALFKVSNANSGGVTTSNNFVVSGTAISEFQIKGTNGIVSSVTTSGLSAVVEVGINETSVINESSQTVVIGDSAITSPFMFDVNGNSFFRDRVAIGPAHGGVPAANDLLHLQKSIAGIVKVVIENTSGSGLGAALDLKGISSGPTWTIKGLPNLTISSSTDDFSIVQINHDAPANSININANGNFAIQRSNINAMLDVGGDVFVGHTAGTDTTSLNLAIGEYETGLTYTTSPNTLSIHSEGVEQLQFDGTNITALTPTILTTVATGELTADSLIVTNAITANGSVALKGTITVDNAIPFIANIIKSSAIGLEIQDSDTDAKIKVTTDGVGIGDITPVVNNALTVIGKTRFYGESPNATNYVQTYFNGTSNYIVSNNTTPASVNDLTIGVAGTGSVPKKLFITVGDSNTIASHTLAETVTITDGFVGFGTLAPDAYIHMEEPGGDTNKIDQESMTFVKAGTATISNTNAIGDVQISAGTTATDTGLMVVRDSANVWVGVNTTAATLRSEDKDFYVTGTLETTGLATLNSISVGAATSSFTALLTNTSNIQTTAGDMIISAVGTPTGKLSFKPSTVEKSWIRGSGDNMELFATSDYVFTSTNGDVKNDRTYYSKGGGSATNYAPIPIVVYADTAANLNVLNSGKTVNGFTLPKRGFYRVTFSLEITEFDSKTSHDLLASAVECKLNSVSMCIVRCEQYVSTGGNVFHFAGTGVAKIASGGAGTLEFETSGADLSTVKSSVVNKIILEWVADAPGAATSYKLS